MQQELKLFDDDYFLSYNNKENEDSHNNLGNFWD